MRRYIFTNKIISALLSLLIVASLYSPWLNNNLARIAPQAEIPIAQAVFCGNCANLATQALDFVESKWNAVQNTLSAASNYIQSQGTISILGKEFGWDTVAYILAKAVIRAMTASIVNWINSGFQGGPSFVTDLRGFLIDVADRAVEDVLTGTELEFLCSPFALDVKIALAFQFRVSDEVQCTISDIIDNVDNFLNGAFEDGGLEGWFEITARPQNTRLGAALTATQKTHFRVLDAQGREIEFLSFGDGFFSKSFCEVVGEEENCVVDVPGKVIEKQLNNVLDSPRMAGLLADELGEAVGVIFGALVNQAFTAGLSALSGSGFNGTSGSYLDALVAEGSTGQFLIIEEQMSTAIRNEERFIILYQSILSIIANLRRKNEEAREAARIIIREDTDDDGEFEEREIACYDLEVPENLLELEEKASSTIPLGDAAIIVVDDLQNRLRTGTSITDQNAIIDEFIAMQNNDAVITLNEREHVLLGTLLDQFSATEDTEERARIIDTLKTADLVGGLHNEVEFARAEVVDLRAAEERGAEFEKAIQAEVARCAEVEDRIRNTDRNGR